MTTMLSFFFLLLLLSMLMMVVSVDGVRFQFQFHNNVGFAADLSMLVYAAFVAERRIANGESGEFCINRFNGWRFMACESRMLDCFFDAGAPFKLCDERGRGAVGAKSLRPKEMTVPLDGLHFVFPMGFADAVRLSNQVFRPNAELQRIVEAKMTRLGLTNGFVALHIRRGDSTWEKGNWLPIDTFVVACRRAASEIADLRRPIDVYVATDTAEVVEYFDARQSSTRRPLQFRDRPRARSFQFDWIGRFAEFEPVDIHGCAKRRAQPTIFVRSQHDGLSRGGFRRHAGIKRWSIGC
jgi:hypothetical protein